MPNELRSTWTYFYGWLLGYTTIDNTLQWCPCDTTVSVATNSPATAFTFTSSPSTEFTLTAADNDSSLPSFDLQSSGSEMDLRLPAVKMPDYSTEKSIIEHHPLNAVAAEPLQPEYTTITGSSFCQGDKLTDKRKEKKGQLSFYMLISLLYDEAVTVNIQMHLVSENKLPCRECKKYHKAQSAIFYLWDDYALEIKQQINYWNLSLNMFMFPINSCNSCNWCKIYYACHLK